MKETLMTLSLRREVEVTASVLLRGRAREMHKAGIWERRTKELRV